MLPTGSLSVFHGNILFEPVRPRDVVFCIVLYDFSSKDDPQDTNTPALGLDRFFA